MGLRGLFSIPAFLILGSCSAAGQIQNPFPNAPVLKLFVEKDYVFENSKILYDGKSGIILTNTQREKFENSLRIEKEPDGMMACFVPHHFFRYYDERGKVVGAVDICFCCSGIQAKGSEKLKAGEEQILGADYDEIKKLVRELGESTDVEC